MQVPHLPTSPPPSLNPRSKKHESHTLLCCSIPNSGSATSLLLQESQTRPPQAWQLYLSRASWASEELVEFHVNSLSHAVQVEEEWKGCHSGGELCDERRESRKRIRMENGDYCSGYGGGGAPGMEVQARAVFAASNCVVNSSLCSSSNLTLAPQTLRTSRRAS